MADYQMAQGLNTGLSSFWDAFKGERSRSQDIALQEAKLKHDKDQEEEKMGLEVFKQTGDASYLSPRMKSMLGGQPSGPAQQSQMQQQPQSAQPQSKMIPGQPYTPQVSAPNFKYPETSEFGRKERERYKGDLDTQKTLYEFSMLPMKQAEAAQNFQKGKADLASKERQDREERNKTNIPGLSLQPGYAPSQGEVTELKGRMSAREDVMRLADELADMVKDGGTALMPGERKDRMSSLYGTLQLKIKEADKLGQISGTDIKLIENKVGSNPTELGTAFKYAMVPNEVMAERYRQVGPETEKSFLADAASKGYVPSESTKLPGIPGMPPVASGIRANGVANASSPSAPPPGLTREQFSIWKKNQKNGK